jgi:hypothetical protein
MVDLFERRSNELTDVVAKMDEASWNRHLEGRDRRIYRGRQVNDAKIPSAQAGYMELTGAQKDGDCRKVEVAGGVSRERGCCNEFKPEDDETIRFSCGTCEYVIGRSLGSRLVIHIAPAPASVSEPEEKESKVVAARASSPPDKSNDVPRKAPRGTDGTRTPNMPKQRPLSAGSPSSSTIPNQMHGMAGDMSQLKKVRKQEMGMSGDMGNLENIPTQAPGMTGQVGKRKSFGKRIARR